MSVYIESVILDNFFITLLISVLSYRALSLSRSYVRLLGASVLGTAAAVAYPLLSLHAAIILALKAALFLALSFILFFKKGKFISSSAVFLAFTFTFGGALFAIGLCVHGSVEKALTLPVSNFPPGLIIAAGWLFYAVFKKTARKLKRLRAASEYTGYAEIDIFGKTVSFPAFLDTGNRLYDTKTDLPVVVLNARAALKVLGEENFSAFLKGETHKISASAHFMPFSGAGGGKSKLLILKPDALRFYLGQSAHTITDVTIGLAFTKFSDAAAYDIILHPALLKQNNKTVFAV